MFGSSAEQLERHEKSLHQFDLALVFLACEWHLALSQRHIYRENPKFHNLKTSHLFYNIFENRKQV